MPRIIVETKGFEIDHTDVGKINAAMVVVFDQATFSIANDDKCISTSPEDASVPAALSENTSASINATPGQSFQVQRPKRVFLFGRSQISPAHDKMIIKDAAVGEAKSRRRKLAVHRLFNK